MTLADLPTHCSNEVTALSEAEVSDLLDQISGWRLTQGALERRINFPNFHQTMAFVNAVAQLANEQDHHPDMHIAYGRCVVRFNTHSVRGISVNDFICAQLVNAMQPTSA
ncbi:4a-hydroxytetrahydrobiopterin dehydratase [Roseateles toxinivorans]|uniref:Putative pterin-4-alpha-carbinolamine dehydratase n=1 Tax=Roseateles toxinivorans TaxID=270368 RepID=A0A4R6QJK3_9BURK|nr:4a-hydroxytetrahydrobiopterin dehydratase [Roseateles toxinivorans]TDP63053.1 4a-hydroxytetrahydrobiopterin dehydratase [Roseateles toxinivorans]